MGPFSGFELLIIIAFVLIIFGPDKLPEMARTLGKFIRQFKAAQQSMETMIRAEMYAAERKERLDNAPDWTKTGERVQQWTAARAASGQAAGDAEPSPSEVEPEEMAPVPVELDAGGNPAREALDAPALRIPADRIGKMNVRVPDELRVLPERVRRRDFGRIDFRPQALGPVAKSRNPAFGRHTGPGEDHEVLQSAEPGLQVRRNHSG